MDWLPAKRMLYPRSVSWWPFLLSESLLFWVSSLRPPARPRSLYAEAAVVAMAKKLMPIEKRAAIAVTAAILPVSAQERNRGHCTMQQKNKDKKIDKQNEPSKYCWHCKFYKWDMKRQHRENFINKAMKNFAKKLALDVREKKNLSKIIKRHENVKTRKKQGRSFFDPQPAEVKTEQQNLFKVIHQSHSKIQ